MEEILNLSGITTIVVKEGEYACAECLQGALDHLGISHEVRISHSDNGFNQIEMREKAQDNQSGEVRRDLKEKIRGIHEKILPKYTELHAIHDFQQRGFKYREMMKTQTGYKYIFEKVVGSGQSQQTERYIIEVIPSENRILIDGGNMPGRRCREQAKKFEKEMGKFQSFIPHSTSQQNAIQSTTKQKGAIKLQSRR